MVKFSMSERSKLLGTAFADVQSSGEQRPTTIDESHVRNPLSLARQHFSFEVESPGLESDFATPSV